MEVTYNGTSIKATPSGRIEGFPWWNFFFGVWPGYVPRKSMSSCPFNGDFNSIWVIQKLPPPR